MTASNDAASPCAFKSCVEIQHGCDSARRQLSARCFTPWIRKEFEESLTIFSPSPLFHVASSMVFHHAASAIYDFAAISSASVFPPLASSRVSFAASPIRFGAPRMRLNSDAL